ncbi:MAG: hypothetical protein NTV48_03010 [Candidatus Vogelbacteria bacterium]|nr:hypothetical protein [Candidatus Vogelbacteria bacterium]
MENQLIKSFIPKQSIGDSLKKRKEPVDLITYSVVIIFVLSFAYFAGLYAYRYYIYNNINRPCVAGSTSSCGLMATYELEKKNFKYADLSRLKRMDTKLKGGLGVLNSHQTLLPFFSALGKMTLKDVQYNSFTFDKNGITLEGVAPNYEAIANQQKVFTEQKSQYKFNSFVFSDFKITKDDKVSFKLSLSVDRSLLLYVNNQTGQGQ